MNTRDQSFSMYGVLPHLIDESYNSGKIVPELEERLKQFTDKQRKIMGDKHLQSVIDAVCSLILSDPEMKEEEGCSYILTKLHFEPAKHYYQAIVDDVISNEQRKVVYHCPEHFNIEECYYPNGYPNGKSMAPLVEPFSNRRKKALIESAQLTDSRNKIEFVCVEYEKKDDESEYHQTGRKSKGTYELISGERTFDIYPRQ